MGKYIAKRLGYMVVVALILSLLMFLVYTMIPYDRAVVEVDSYKASLKNNPNAGELYEKKLAEKRHELGTDQNVFIRYLGWASIRASCRETSAGAISIPALRMTF